MITEQNINEWAERYLEGTLTGNELALMHRSLDADPVLYRQWAQAVELLRTFRDARENKDIRSLIASVAADKQSWSGEEATGPEALPRPVRVIPFGKYLRTSAVAAALVLCSSLATYFVVNKKDAGKADREQVTLLRREVERIRHSQSKIIDSLNKNKAGMSEMPDEETALYGGTGFALTNDGYIATNYHVVKDANAIYVQTRKGDMKAYIVAREPNSDIAILKLEDKSYRFGKVPLPYNIARPVSGLGQRVFTIGYPKDDVVYNEGYISCESGYQGDRSSYQLEMTANPGQSGSPVLDKYGSVIALITSKQNNTSGTTYAVHADALIDLVESLPKATAIRLPEANRMSRMERTEQVKKMRDYVFSIKVN